MGKKPPTSGRLSGLWHKAGKPSREEPIRQLGLVTQGHPMTGLRQLVPFPDRALEPLDV